MDIYNQKEKNKVRIESLTKAIRLLTKDRTDSTIAARNYIRKVKQYIICNEKEPYISYAKQLSNKTIKRWECFYDSIVGHKSPSNLKVAYLCGPNPLNDLLILTKLGVLPENVWAFEVESENYNSAVITTLYSQYPYLKIIKGDIGNFLSYTPVKFDLVYFDFCGPLPNRNKKQKNLENLSSLFYNHNLNSPGIVLTNFSLPSTQQDHNGRELITKLVASYLYPKEFLESGQQEKHNNFIEGATSHGYNINSWTEIVRNDLENYYGQYITRLINDMACLIIPYQRFTKNNKYLKHFFNSIYLNPSSLEFNDRIKNELQIFKNFTEDGGGGDIHIDPGMYPLIWTLKNLEEQSIVDSNFKYFSDLFLNQLSCLKNLEELNLYLSLMHLLMTEKEEISYFYSENLKYISQNWDPFKKVIFCDVFLFTHVKDLLIHQLSVPYHLNIESTTRWTYKAKDTQMFMDLLLFDECRYIYDWMPTVDMLEYNLNDPEIELSFRFALDAICKNRTWYNTEFFFGTAIIDKFANGFNGKTLKLRKII